MASITFYLLADTAAGTSGYGSLQDGGTPPSTGDTNSGWQDSGTGTGPQTYAKYFRGANRLNSAFTTTVEPDGTLDNTNGDCLRSQNTYTGTFTNANWTFTFGIRANSSLNSDGVKLRFRVFRSANQNGSSATELTSAAQVSATVTDNSTSAQTVTITWSSPGAITLNNEYLFVELAYQQNALNNDAATWKLQQGAAYTISTPNFSAGQPETNTFSSARPFARDYLPVPPMYRQNPANDTAPVFSLPPTPFAETNTFTIATPWPAPGDHKGNRWKCLPIYFQNTAQDLSAPTADFHSHKAAPLWNGKVWDQTWKRLPLHYQNTAQDISVTPFAETNTNFIAAAWLWPQGWPRPQLAHSLWQNAAGDTGPSQVFPPTPGAETNTFNWAMPWKRDYLAIPIGYRISGDTFAPPPVTTPGAETNTFVIGRPWKKDYLNVPGWYIQQTAQDFQAPPQPETNTFYQARPIPQAWTQAFSRPALADSLWQQAAGDSPPPPPQPETNTFSTARPWKRDYISVPPWYLQNTANDIFQPVPTYNAVIVPAFYTQGWSRAAFAIGYWNNPAQDNLQPDGLGFLLAKPWARDYGRVPSFYIFNPAQDLPGATPSAETNTFTLAKPWVITFGRVPAWLLQNYAQDITGPTPLAETPICIVARSSGFSVPWNRTTIYQTNTAQDVTTPPIQPETNTFNQIRPWVQTYNRLPSLAQNPAGDVPPVPPQPETNTFMPPRAWTVNYNRPGPLIQSGAQDQSFTTGETNTFTIGRPAQPRWNRATPYITNTAQDITGPTPLAETPTFTSARPWVQTYNRLPLLSQNPAQDFSAPIQPETNSFVVARPWPQVWNRWQPGIWNTAQDITGPTPLAETPTHVCPRAWVYAYVSVPRWLLGNTAQDISIPPQAETNTFTRARPWAQAYARLLAYTMNTAQDINGPPQPISNPILPGSTAIGLR